MQTRLCVLVCDDEELVREVVCAALVASGYDVERAAEGQAALAIVGQNPERFACALVDRRMPGLDGVEVIARLRALRPSLPAILISGVIDGGLRLDHIAGPPVGLLPKPFLPSALVRAVAAQIGAHAS